VQHQAVEKGNTAEHLVAQEANSKGDLAASTLCFAYCFHPLPDHFLAL
jgi:hypothetical protein